MEKFKFNYVTEEMAEQLNELWDNGYKEALIAFGKDMYDIGIEHYRQGLRQGRLDAEKATKTVKQIAKKVKK